MHPIFRILPLSLALAAAPACQSVKKGWDVTADGTRSVIGKVTDTTTDLTKGAANMVTGIWSDSGQNVSMTIRMDGREGVIVMALDDKAAPEHAANFRKLVKEGFYDNLPIHRVIKDEIIQAGDPRARNPKAREIWGLGGPGYTLPAEISLPHERGSVAMARLGDRVNPTRRSNGSQFYICLKRLPDLDGQYTVFGKVVSGIEWADAISRAQANQNQIPVKDIRIVSATLVAGSGRPASAPPQPETKPSPAAGAPAPSPAAAVAPDAGEARKPGFFRRMWPFGGGGDQE